MRLNNACCFYACSKNIVLCWPIALSRNPVQGVQIVRSRVIELIFTRTSEAFLYRNIFPQALHYSSEFGWKTTWIFMINLIRIDAKKQRNLWKIFLAKNFGLLSSCGRIGKILIKRPPFKINTITVFWSLSQMVKRFDVSFPRRVIEFNPQTAHRFHNSHQRLDCVWINLR